jgi:hypothetical protein
MKVVYTLSLLLLCVVFTQSTYSILTPIDITMSPWKFSNDNGYLGIIEFKPNGLITNYLHPNEYSWKLNDNQML